MKPRERSSKPPLSQKLPPARPCPPPTARIGGCGRGTLVFRKLGGGAFLGRCDRCGKTVGLA